MLYSILSLPYFINKHFCKFNFDGEFLILLTHSTGTKQGEMAAEPCPSKDMQTVAFSINDSHEQLTPDSRIFSQIYNNRWVTECM